MLNDSILAVTAATDCADRRLGCRVPFPSEVLLLWHHDLATTARYRVLDASDGGLRIRSSVPLTEGMTGMAVKLLPDGQAIDRPVMVAWQRPSEDDSHQMDVGLRFF